MAKNDILSEVQKHYQDWTDDNNTRRTRENGWDDVLDAFFGKLPDNWPYLSRVVDPRLRTSIIEKKARLTNSKLRGKVVAREGSDIVKARIQNSLLDFQWDNATEGGTMNHKWGLMDQDTRLFGSCFALTKWKYEKDKDGKVLFNGNEFEYLDVRDVGLINGQNVRDTEWVQVRKYITLNELKNENCIPGKPKWDNIAELEERLNRDIQDRRDNNYTSRIKDIKGIDDRLGSDDAFPVIEIVTEYRPDRWITFSPKHNLLLRDIDNPYDHKKIPIVQLKYFPLSDDPWGESEVESVLGLWRGIQATVCGFLDSMNVHMKPPLKIVEGAVRMETIEWSPEATWIVDRLDSVEEHRSSGDPLRFFQTTYSALVAAFNSAMGDSSQGVGGVDPFNPEKTATEIKHTAKQQNVRDQDNQNALSDAIKDMMSMWISNNKQFLFADPKMHEYVLRIVGEKDFGFFKELGMADMTVDHESINMIGDTIEQLGGDVSEGEMMSMVSSAETPAYPIIENPEEKNIDKLRIKPKLRLNESGKEAELSIIPDDFSGNVDYVPDVKSMASGADSDLIEARKNAVELLFNNTNVLQLLQQEGLKPNVKEILTEIFEDAGTKDADRFFSQIQGQTGPQEAETSGLPAGPQQAEGIVPPVGRPRLANLPGPSPTAVPPQQLA